MGKSKFDIIIQESDAAGLGKELLEVGIDTFTNDETLKSLPGVSMVLAPFKFYNSISKYIFVKKIAKFIKQLDGTTAKERQKMIDEINNSGKYENSVGETIFEILDSIDSEKKPYIIGNLFKSFIIKNISYRDFLKLTHIVKNCLIDDLYDFKAKVKGAYVYGEVTDELMIFGLYSPDLVGRYEDGKNGDTEASYGELTVLGTSLIQYGF